MLNKPGIITQARMTSTRLPGKILLEANSRSLLDFHVSRLQWSGIPVVIATTTNKTDDQLVEFCEKRKLGYFRGDENDVLSRYKGAADKFGFDVIVRVTSDCPLIDGHLIKEHVTEYLKLNRPEVDLTNTVERTYPRGFDFEIFSKSLLDRAFREATENSDREHVTLYLKKPTSGFVELRHITTEPNLSFFRLTVDEPDDYKMLKTLIEVHHCGDKNYAEIAAVLRAHPELKKINGHVEQKKT